MIPRRAVVAASGAVLIVLGALSLVVPGDTRVMVAVSRLGSTVRLLPLRPGLSFLPLERRIALGRSDGAAVFDVPLLVPSESGTGLEARLDLVITGAGPLPVDASVVRERGWETAWAEWTLPKLELDHNDVDTLVRGSSQWSKIFPDAPPVGVLDVSGQLAGGFQRTSLISARLQADQDQDVIRAAAGRELAHSTRARGRLVVLGLDGLDWRLVDELTGKGRLPNLGRLIERGAQAEVTVRPPLLSPLIWTSIATGVYPEVHGVLDFVERDPISGQPRPVGSASRKVPALWEIAAAAGRTTAVIGWWATFPAVAPAGATVYSDRLTEQIFAFEGATDGSAHPPEAADTAVRLRMRRAELTPELLAPVLAVTREELDGIPKDSGAWDHPIGGILSLMAATITIERLTDHELRRGTEVVLVYLEGTDTVGHLFGPHRPPHLPIVTSEDERRYGSVPDRYYAHVDRWIGRVTEQLGDRDTLVVLSDHGFRWFEDRPLVAAGAHTATAEQWHRKEAVFIVAGPTVRSGRARHPMTLIDAAACLFALAGLPVGEKMPGVVPSWLVDVRDRSTVRVDYSELVSIEGLAEASRRTSVAPEVSAEQLARLRALGYLGDAEEEFGSEAAPGYDRFEARRLHNLALRLTDAGDLNEAETCFRQAIAADPTYVPPHYAFAFLLRTTGRYDEADRHLWQAVDLDTDDPAPGLVRVAQHYLNLGQIDRAEAVLTEASNRFPESGTLWLHLGALYGERGDFGASRVCLERAIELDPQDPLAYRNLAALQVATGDFAGARRSLTLALQLEPGNEEIRRQLAGLAPQDNR